ncbi:MAG: hypothetical protein KUG78_21910, partial [Kangiellaceae bacterium]|nr:hypothetical protein [Kangiellaceae bacterium]
MAELNKKIFEGACENYHGYKVSMFSFWEDPEWIFSEESSNGGPVKIYWKVILGDGSELTDDKNWQLLDACKRFIWSLHVTPPRGQGHTSASRKPISLRINFSRLYALLKWMTTADVNCFSFSALTSIDIDDYIVHIIQHLKISTGEEPIQKTLSGLLSPISLLYLQRRKLPDAVEVEPFDGYSAFKYATKLTNNKGNKIPYMPDEIAKPIISSAVKEVQGSAPKVIEFSEFLLPYYYEFEDGLINKKKEDCFKGKAGDLRWYLGKNAEKHWCDIIEKLNSLEIPHQLSKKVEVQKLKLLHTKLINEVIESSSACILATVGLRASELIHLDINCWEKFESIDGLLNIHVINGITFKLETGPREATWSAGATEMCREVEVDKEKLPIAIEAIKTVTRLLAPWRDAILCETLFLTPPQLWLSTADQKGRNKYSRMTTGLLNKRLKTFSKRVELPYEWNISSHQFRKTFARFVAKLDKKALGALAEQY